jgi:hypothetical protein
MDGRLAMWDIAATRQRGRIGLFVMVALLGGTLNKKESVFKLSQANAPWERSGGKRISRLLRYQ